MLWAAKVLAIAAGVIVDVILLVMNCVVTGGLYVKCTTALVDVVRTEDFWFAVSVDVYVPWM